MNFPGTIDVSYGHIKRLRKQMNYTLTDNALIITVTLSVSYISVKQNYCICKQLNGIIILVHCGMIINETIVYNYIYNIYSILFSWY